MNQHSLAKHSALSYPVGMMSWENPDRSQHFVMLIHLPFVRGRRRARRCRVCDTASRALIAPAPGAICETLHRSEPWQIVNKLFQTVTKPFTGGRK